MKTLTQKLVEAWGPSGFEHQVRALVMQEVQDLCDEMRVDTMGNLICRVGTKTETNKRVMVAAHMDEIGLMVSYIDQRGYLRFTSLGGLFPLNLMGNRVKFENGTVGTIGVENYLRRGSDMPSVNDCYIDISEATNEHGLNVNGVVNVGDAAGFWREFEERGNRWIAKSMDDRIGCVVAIETMRQLKQTPSMHEVYFVFTVQEEVGVRGATTSAYGIDPDIGIALDVTPTGDEIKSDKLCNVTLGQGAAIKIRDTGLIVAPQVRDWMTGVAEVKGIPHQREILTGGSTDAKAIHMTRSGVPSGVISVPCRYVHSVSETVDKNDVQACVDLVAALLTQPIEL